MMTTRESPERRMTLLFVCASEELIQMTLDAVDDQGWNITQATFDVYISARRRPHMPHTLRFSDGCIAFIDFDADPDGAASAATYLQQVFSRRIAIVAVSARTDAEAVLKALHAGCMEFLPSPPVPQAVTSALLRTAQAQTDHASASFPGGSVLALLGAKGGVGTTTLGVHLAVYLVEIHRKKVLLIDSKPQFGHVCIYLGANGSGCHFQELVSVVHRLDSELLKAFVGHHASGLDLLSSPDLGQTARTMHPDDVAATLEFLRAEYDFVIVDCADSGDPITQAVIAASSQVYLVATPDITAIRDLSRHVDDLSRLEISSQIQVVVNRYSSQFAVSLREIEKAIRTHVSFSIPNNYIELVRSANLGEPVSSDGKSGFTTELLKWAHSLVGSAPQSLASGAQPARKHLWQSIRNLIPSLNLQSSTATATGKRN